MKRATTVVPEGVAMSPLPPEDDCLKAIRTRTGITQAALAELVGTDETTIGAIEAGETVPHDVCARIAEALNVPVDVVMAHPTEATDT